MYMCTCIIIMIIITVPIPPACASMIPVATGVPGINPNSPAALSLNPKPTDLPGTCTLVPTVHAQ